MNHADEAGKTISTPPPTGGEPGIPFAAEAETATASPAVDEAFLMRSAGLREVKAWGPVFSRGKDSRLLRESCLKASHSLQKTIRWLRKLTSEGRAIPSEIRPLAHGAPRVRSALREAREALNGDTIGKLPRLQSNPTLPRMYTLACDFLKAIHFIFQEETLRACLDDAQRQWPLDINEIWAMKPLLQLALLEEIAREAEALRARAGTKTLQSPFATQKCNLEELILSLQAIEHVDWENFFDRVSCAEKILREDPVYAQMAPESRDMYRKEILSLAAHSPLPEMDIAVAAVNLARAARRTPGEDVRLFERRLHVGFYLVDEGRTKLEETIRYQAPLHQRMERVFLRSADYFYVIAIELVTVGLIAFLLSGLHLILPIFAAIALLLLPATESAVRIVNQLASFLVRPRLLPKMEFGIPPDSMTMVVVPTLLLSEKQVRETVEGLEVRYLANANPNLHFALLTDSADSFHPLDEGDELVGLCAKLIQDLNRKYQDRGNGSFFLFHRHRIYNPAEGAWMGWERKRGKLLDLNNLLRNNFDNFPVKIGDLSLLPKVRYVITLDADTMLPRGAAQQLVGALAHPLNRAVIDPEPRIVVKGYGILQPRVGVSVQSAARSRLASIYSGQTGFDLYTRAISDVYQDLFGEGSFTGKGIYEVDVYQKVLDQRFPANALLSHDLIEGSYARAGLVSDVEVIDDYPSHFSAYCRRKHRWVRGDWQILRWLLNHVPDYSGKPALNPLPFISRWKILDNLRRSLIEAATLALLLGGWFFLPGGALYWTVAALILLLVPCYFQFFLAIATALGSPNWAGGLREATQGFVTEQVGVLFNLLFLLHQSLVTLDAIFRTLVRLAVTHKRLLEWETAAQAELKNKMKTPADACLQWTPWLSLTLGAALAFTRPAALPVALPFLGAWLCSRLISQWLDTPVASREGGLTREEMKLLGSMALRTWRFFREWSNNNTNWLVPDNVQESPFSVAKALSPTNLGILLNARLAAYDLGYLTVEEFTEETRRTMEAAERLPRYKGHFFNWNHIEKLEPIEPLFVSTVDSGNLAVCLWTLKQGCLEMIRRPLFQQGLWKGFSHHLNLLEMLANNAPSSRKDRARFKASLKQLDRRFKSLGEDAASWIAHLHDLEQNVREIEEQGVRGDNAQSHREKQWCAAELHRRLTSLKSLADRFAPWMLPEHQPLFRSLGLEIRPNDATLATLLQMLAGIEDKIKSTGQDTQPCGQSLLKSIQASRDNAQSLMATLALLAEGADALVAAMDFRFLYHPHRNLLAIGCDVTARRVEKACYDLLASEARAAVFVAIAKGDIRQESWFRLGRRHTLYEGERVLLSWSGTMFEYLMPALWMRSYPDTILAQTQRAVVRCQQRFSRRGHRPWGVSEAGYSLRDEAEHYQYQAFGIPALALSTESTANVVAPYATFLALGFDPAGAIRNLRRMARMGWLSAYGFYESVDYNTWDHDSSAPYKVVRSWMAHHQGMSLLALSNLLAGASIQRRFHKEPQVQATEPMLHERVPATLTVVPAEEPIGTAKT